MFEDMLLPRLDKGVLVISVTALFIFGKKFDLRRENKRAKGVGPREERECACSCSIHYMVTNYIERH